MTALIVTIFTGFVLVACFVALFVGEQWARGGGGEDEALLPLKGDEEESQGGGRDFLKYD